MGYPVSLNLTGKSCVVVGGGRVAARKVSDLLESKAEITIISPALESTLATWEQEGILTVEKCLYTTGMLAERHPFLVIAATNQPDVNRQVYEEARALNSLINVVDAPELSDFYSMATMRRGPLTMSIASGGAAPALTAHLRQQMESSIGPEYETLAVWMAELRPEVRAHLASKTARAALWQRVIASPVLTYLHEGNFNQARAVLESLVQEAFES